MTVTRLTKWASSCSVLFFSLRLRFSLVVLAIRLALSFHFDTHTHTHTQSFFFCKDGSDWLMKRASHSCCNFLCVVLAAAYLLEVLPVSLFVLTIRLAHFFVVTHIRTLARTRARSLTHSLALFLPLSFQHQNCKPLANPVRQQRELIQVTCWDLQSLKRKGKLTPSMYTGTRSHNNVCTRAKRNILNHFESNLF